MLRTGLTSGACGALRLVGGRHNTVGVSLRASWDTTLVLIIVTNYVINTTKTMSVYVIFRTDNNYLIV